MEPEKTISQHCNDVIVSYMRNNIGETRLLIPGVEEQKPQFKVRAAQGIIDLIVNHFKSMAPEDDKKVLSTVIHHNQIHEFMRIFGR